MVCTCSVTHSAIWKLITAIDGASATAGGTTEQAKAAARRKSRGTIPSGAPGGSPPGRLVSGVLRRDYMGALVPSGALGLPPRCGRRTRARLGAHRWDVGGEVPGGNMQFTPSAPSGGRPPGGRGTARDISEAGSWYCYLCTAGGSVSGVVGPRSSRPSWWPPVASLRPRPQAVVHPEVEGCHTPTRVL